jgi:hypothetical protein
MRRQLWRAGHFPLLAAAVLLGQLLQAGEARADLTINIIPGAGLASNPDALAAFDRAAAEWSGAIATNITVNIDADLANLGGGGIIGSTQSLILKGGYDLVRNALAAHAGASPSLSFLSALPTASQFSAFVPAGGTLDGSMYLTQANANALGFNVNLGHDAQITFNSLFAFAYNAGQLNGSTMDFQTVAAHEIGHALGFISNVDEYDRGARSTGPTTLDLFRFASNSIPSTLAGFTNTPRMLAPGVAASTLISLGSGQAMSTGVFQGDGRQASHWKDDSLTGSLIGIMDPTLAFNTVETVDANDLRAMELIGYTLRAVPEPSSMAVAVGTLLIGMVFRSSRRSGTRVAA